MILSKREKQKSGSDASLYFYHGIYSTCPTWGKRGGRELKVGLGIGPATEQGFPCAGGSGASVCNVVSTALGPELSMLFKQIIGSTIILLNFFCLF